MKCLIVDDSSVTRRILVNTLRTLGFAPILEAADGETALQLCDPSVDIVLTDWNMPGMAGVDLVRAMRSRPELHDIPVLIITSRQVKQDVVEAAQAGVNGYILKPFTPDVLRERVHEVLAANKRAASANAAPADAGTVDSGVGAREADAAEAATAIDEAAADGGACSRPGPAPDSGVSEDRAA